MPFATGIGYITDTDLIFAYMSRKGNPYIRVFEDCIKDCHPVPDKSGEYKGDFYEMNEKGTGLRIFADRFCQLNL